MGKPIDRKVLVIDVESTCWERAEERPANEISEIIEIGVAIVDIDSLQLLRSESVLIKPQKSKLSKFCTQLTTLTQEQVDEGVTFQEAMQIMRSKYASQDRLFVSWGDYDRKMFERNCQDYGVKYPFGPRHLNLKNTFTILHGLSREPGLDGALKHLGMTLDGTHHRGVDDARNIAKIFVHTLKKFRNA